MPITFFTELHSPQPSYSLSISSGILYRSLASCIVILRSLLPPVPSLDKKIFLLTERMKLDLIYRGHNFAVQDKIHKPVGLKIAYSDCPDLFLPV